MLTGRARQLSDSPDSMAPEGRDTFARKIQLNIRFINPWTVNSNARGGELDLVTPFAGEFRLLTSATPPPTEFPCPGADYVYNVSVFGVSSAIHLYPVRFTCIQCDSRTGYPLNAIMRSLTP